ncbi:MAG: 50S ribosomal protein L37ae [Candidatus Woesearchaeota archaeon]|nr:MAG: 50S ribosomal protein L37ae [Candidatus Woesearchaeota archaeon]
MGRTKKVGSAGRFGSRYGVTIRKKIAEIEKKQKAKYKCPKCHYKTVKRVSVGIWKCNKCNTKIGGKAYEL